MDRGFAQRLELAYQTVRLVEQRLDRDNRQLLAGSPPGFRGLVAGVRARHYRSLVRARARIHALLGQMRVETRRETVLALGHAVVDPVPRRADSPRPPWFAVRCPRGFQPAEVRAALESLREEPLQVFCAHPASRYSVIGVLAETRLVAFELQARVDFLSDRRRAALNLFGSSLTHLEVNGTLVLNYHDPYPWSLRAGALAICVGAA